MLRRILIGIDHTQASAAALRLGVRWARRCGATLFGLAVVDEPGIRAIEPAWSVGGKPGVDPVYYLGYERRLAEAKDQARQLADQFAARCNEEGTAHAESVRIGSPHEQIRLEMESCDLIVLGRGSQFRFIAEDDEADDTLKKVLKESRRPAVVAPGTTHTDGPVVIAFDGSLQAVRALEAFVATGLAESGKLHVVSIDSSPNHAAVHADAARKLLSDRKIESIPHSLSSPASPAEMILEQAARLNASLLVMGAYGQPFLREFFLGSVTRKVLEKSTVPLFLYH